VTTSPTSYLQTLDKDEAISFVASLQKVKQHLSHELQWINAQAKQKTTQLQGIEAILTEAVTLGLISQLHTESISPDIDSTVADDLELPTLNGYAALTESLTTTPSSSDRPPVGNAQPKSTSKSTAKTPTSQKTRSSKSKSGKKSSGKTSLSGKSPDLKHFVRAEFQDESFTDAVAHILERSGKPIGLSDVIANLYGDLSNQDYQRAKISLTNVLSTGKNKGKWKSIGRGMYASNAVAAAL
jgi:hypothetical protein